MFSGLPVHVGVDQAAEILEDGEAETSNAGRDDFLLLCRKNDSAAPITITVGLVSFTVVFF